MRDALVSAPMLARLNFLKPFNFRTDANNNSIGALLKQEDEKGEHMIVHVNGILTDVEKNYSTTE